MIRAGRSAALGMGLLSAAGCSNDASAPATGPSLQILAGANQTDSARTALAQPLIVQVRDSSGALKSGYHVQFQVVCGSLCPVSLLTGAEHGALVTPSTGANGQVSVQVFFETRAGPATVQIAVAQLGLSATAGFTITPGMPALVAAIPKDTALYVGAGFHLRGSVTDQNGNPVAGAVSYTALSATATIGASDTITAHTIGRAPYIVQGFGHTDTGWVSVVPPGQIAAMGADGLAMMNLDGSSYKPLAPSNSYYNGYPSWGNPPTTLAFDYAGTDKLASVDTSGHVQLLLTAGDSGIVTQVWPSYSHDGSWIYFQGDALVWKVHGDGTGLTRVSPSGTVGAVDRYPSPSRTDAQLVLATSRSNSSNGLDIEIFDLGTSTFTSLGVNGVSPRWSPVTDSIAYVDVDGRVKVLAADGSGLRAVTPVGQSFKIAIDWSPDGQWLLAQDSYALELIQVSTGMMLPLGYATSMSDAVWRP